MSAFNSAAPPGREEPVEGITVCVMNGPRQGDEYRVDGVRALLGRSDSPDFEADIDLTPCELHSRPVISRRHAEIQLVAGHAQLVAVSDRNGTYVNGVRIEHYESGRPSLPFTLHHGDRITLADLELEIRFDGA